jgi:drug/metabolite transporter (DMT)-like permease
MIGSASVVAWMMLIGLVVVLPVVPVSGASGLGWSKAPWLLLSGFGNVVGMLLVYAALRVERVGLVAPITSTEGGIAALIAAAAGETIGGGTGAALAAVAVGVVLAGIVRESDLHPHSRRGVLLSLTAACLFGAGLYATARVGRELPLIWAVLPARAVGVAVVAVPLVLGSRLRLTRQALPLVLCSGLAEVGGFASYAVGARHGIAVAAVLTAQFAALAAVGGYLLFGERLNRVQVAGVAIIVAGVAALTALQS